VKIIEPGRPQQGWSTEAKCSGRGNGGGGCGAKLLVEQPDLFKTFRVARDETDTFVTFKCPACGVLTDLADGAVPHAIRSVLPSQSAWEGKGQR